MNTKQIVENMEKELEKEMGIDTWNDGKWIKSGQIMLSKDFFNHIRPHISSLLSAFAEEVIQGIDTQNEYLLQEAHKKCTTNDFSNGAFWAHKTMQKILSDQRLKVKEILEVIK